MRWQREGHQCNVQFVYDGDGNRLLKIESQAGLELTTYYAGQLFEKQFNTTAKRLGENVPAGGSSKSFATCKGRTTGVTDYGFTGQRHETGFGLMDYNARYYSPQLGRFISPDTIVPDPMSGKGFNRYLYGDGNPLRFNDPSGHCAGDPNDADNPDAQCWSMIGQIESTYTNISVQNQDRWILPELQAVWKALANHVFIKDILAAPNINLFRATSDGRGSSGAMSLINEGNNGIIGYNVSIYDNAYIARPDGNGTGSPSLRNFQGTVIHELAHVATFENPFIIESYRLRSNPFYHPDTLIRQTIGAAYPQSNCGASCDYEYIAIAASTWQLSPESFQFNSLVVSYTDWRKEWIELFYTPNPLVTNTGQGPTFLNASR